MLSGSRSRCAPKLLLVLALLVPFARTELAVAAEQSEPASAATPADIEQQLHDEENHLDVTNAYLVASYEELSELRPHLDGVSGVISGLEQRLEGLSEARSALLAGSDPTDPVYAATTRFLREHGQDPVAWFDTQAHGVTQQLDVRYDDARSLSQRLFQVVDERHAAMIHQNDTLQHLRELRTDLSTARAGSLTEDTPSEAPTYGATPATDAAPFQVCPVDPPRVIADDFGAPRYAGGYHEHAGNDIMAPRGTPIRAPFDGVAEEATNGLGGLAVRVTGQAGYVYNAHLDSFAELGRVDAGDIVGFVGNSGDAQGGPTHDHFEWHPERAGDAVTVNGAIDPHAALTSVC